MRARIADRPGGRRVHRGTDVTDPSRAGYSSEDEWFVRK